MTTAEGRAARAVVVEQVQDDRSSVGAGRRWRLSLLSMLLLFVELALIRWTAANNVHVGTIPNLVLLATFLGIGTGFLVAGRRVDLLGAAPVALALLVGFVLAFPADLVALSGPREFVGLGGHAALPAQVSLPIVFGLVVVVTAGLGQAMARSFAFFRPLDAYRLDLAGSIAGIACFSLLSFADAPPIAWGALAAAGFAALLARRRWWHWIAIATIIGLLAVESLSPNETWSPYYKIVAVAPAGSRGVLAVSGNDIPYQTVYPLSALRRIEPFYFFPYRHVTRADLRDVLVVGAGTGNDVGVALAMGARRVDAVEIDPDLVRLGREHNPERAYQSRRVSVHVDDGRAFLDDTTRRYGLIVYALPDSLTALTGQSAPVGLENYLLTEQAVAAARSHLAPGGIFSMYNYYQPFLLDRYATTIEGVFGNSPCVELGASLGDRRQAVLSVGRSAPAPRCRRVWHGARLAPATDDRPFPYLPTPSVPTTYLWVIALVLAGSLALVRASAGPLRRVGRFADLFFMGAAFMLLESKSVVQFALLFGTTWYVNALVFAGVLAGAYLAVEVARHRRLARPPLLLAALVAALAAAFVVPTDQLLSLPVVARFLAATALAFSPVFLANLLFAQRFRNVATSTTAFGANLLGAIVGGLLEYLSMMTGFRFLLVLVAGLYALAVAFGRRHLASAA